MNKKKTLNEETAKLDALIFIDANIFLDFYRLSNNIQLKFLKLINQNKGIIILTSQIMMEYKKNRRSEILRTITNLNSLKSDQKNYPAIIKEEDTKLIRNLEQQIIDIHKQKIEKFKNIYTNPEENDEVFKALNLLENSKSSLFLSENHEESEPIFFRAKNRFLKGYPPRKSDDTSLGDGINWEWIVECSIKTEKDIILVSRDGDYGKKYENKSYLNDWLLHEFKNRTKKNIVLTSDLSEAFDLLKIRGVNEEMREAEHKIDLISKLEELNKVNLLQKNKNEYLLKTLYQALENLREKRNHVGQMDLFANFEDLDDN